MVYITGDTHGDILHFKKAPIHLKKNDLVIVCGDFGFFCNHDKLARKSLHWLEKQKYTIAVVEGWIDHFDTVTPKETVPFHGGTAVQLLKNVFWLQRGEIYDFEGKSFFAFGGGENLDYMDDFSLEDPFVSSLIDQPTKDHVWETLAAHDYHVDYIITHDAPSKLRTIMSHNDDTVTATAFHRFLDQIWERTSFSGWYFGKYHQDRHIPPIYHGMFQNFDAIP